MPYIDLKVNFPVDDNTKEAVKSEFGQAITALHKGETYLMVGINDSYDLWFGGKKLDKGAYVSVSLLGNASSDDYKDMTGRLCTILNDRLGIPGDCVYVTYHPISDWGWNGSNF